MFASTTYIERRERIARAMGGGCLLFVGNGVASFNYPDNNYMFRQDSTFLYLFGLDVENLAAIIDVDNNRTVLYGDDFTIDDIIWTGPMPTLKDQAAQVGITEVRPMAALTDDVRLCMKRRQPVHFIPPYRGHNILKLQDILGVKVATAPADAFLEGMPVATPSLELCYNIADMRNHKSEEEIAEIERAIGISVHMHQKAVEMAVPGQTEQAISATITAIAQSEGYHISFPNICTTHGQTLHNHGYIHTLKEGDMLLCDAGAETRMHYAGDLTTTTSVGGKFTPRQQAVYDILINTYRNAAASLRPGITYRECHVNAWTSIAEGLKGLGIMKGDAHEAAEAGAVAMFMPHGLGHMMGMDVHDMENYGEVHVGYPRGAKKDPRFGFSSLRLGRMLEPGFVFTVEPGIYFIPELIDKWNAEQKFAEFINYPELLKWRDLGGMRNEEDYLILPDGARRLGPAKPF